MLISLRFFIHYYLTASPNTSHDLLPVDFGNHPQQQPRQYFHVTCIKERPKTKKIESIQ